MPCGVRRVAGTRQTPGVSLAVTISPRWTMLRRYGGGTARRSRTPGRVTLLTVTSGPMSVYEGSRSASLAAERRERRRPEHRCCAADWGLDAATVAAWGVPMSILLSE